MESEPEYESFPSTPSGDESDAGNRNRNGSNRRSRNRHMMNSFGGTQNALGGSPANGEANNLMSQLSTDTDTSLPSTLEAGQSGDQKPLSSSPLATVAFDPFSPQTSASSSNEQESPVSIIVDSSSLPAEALVNVKGNSLLDDQSVTTQDSAAAAANTNNPNSFPGTAGFLEIEQEPPRGGSSVSNAASAFRTTSSFQRNGGEQPITTSSGLLLTHRKSPTVKLPPRDYQQQQRAGRRYKDNVNSAQNFDGFDDDDANDKQKKGGSRLFGAANTNRPYSNANASNTSPKYSQKYKDYFEVENGRSRGRSNPPHGGPSMTMIRAKNLLSIVHVWMILGFVLLLVFTGVFMHSFGHSEDAIQQEQQQQQQQMPEHVLLLPLPRENISQLGSGGRRQLQQDSELYQLELPQLQATGKTTGRVNNKKHVISKNDNKNNKKNNNHINNRNHRPSDHRILLQIEELRQDFENWVHANSKKYHSNEEKESRFHIWSQNHENTKSKNRKHGPCKLTKKEVFGNNIFQDLLPEEFKSKYLTGYRGPMADDWQQHQKHKPIGPDVRRLSRGSGQVLDPAKHKPLVNPDVQKRMLSNQQQQNQQVMQSSSANCVWYDISCWLRWFFQSAGINFGAGTLEPQYDADSYPNAVDWRDVGAVSDVKAQGDCGACWAITAVETIESATFLSTGVLYDLAETEVIVCDDSCEMCSGGWPQNAFEWAMEHGGLLLEDDLPYDDSYLLELTEGMEGTSYTYTADTVVDYATQICPAEADSHDSNDGNAYGSQNQRYGDIGGYGYATDRCLCYTDGSGCDCDSQDEAVAVRNVASYGPATVCLEASLWQDYTGGIITTDLGCTSAFLDMNHCVQVVGYAFSDGSGSGNNEGEDDRDLSSDSGSGSGSQDGGGAREGYWIVRNQWGSSWGMNGYAYVAMGSNTCGVLNDMTQVYSGDK